MDFTVTEAAMRPASVERRCFYCREDIGAQHKPECVLIRKSVKVRMIVEYDITVPNHWDKDRVEFARNRGTWCADNALEELHRLSGEDHCLCGCVRFEYLSDTSGAVMDEG